MKLRDKQHGENFMSKSAVLLVFLILETEYDRTICVFYNIENVIENVIVFLYFWKYKTRKRKYIVSGFKFRVLYFWKYKSTIKYKINHDKQDAP